jgi:hypothetical protein
MGENINLYNCFISSNADIPLKSFAITLLIIIAIAIIFWIASSYEHLDATTADAIPTIPISATPIVPIDSITPATPTSTTSPTPTTTASPTTTSPAPTTTSPMPTTSPAPTTTTTAVTPSTATLMAAASSTSNVQSIYNKGDEITLPSSNDLPTGYIGRDYVCFRQKEGNHNFVKKRTGCMACQVDKSGNKNYNGTNTNVVATCVYAKVADPTDKDVWTRDQCVTACATPDFADITT